MMDSRDLPPFCTRGNATLAVARACSMNWSISWRSEGRGRPSRRLSNCRQIAAKLPGTCWYEMVPDGTNAADFKYETVPDGTRRDEITPTGPN
jgi:hypothetical protein